MKDEVKLKLRDACCVVSKWKEEGRMRKARMKQKKDEGIGFILHPSSFILMQESVQVSQDT
ncbi:MAG: hypothetical protein ABIL11_09445 [Chloroflexota bacterium]